MNRAVTQDTWHLSNEQAARLETRIERCRERAKALAETLDAESEFLGQRRIEGYDELLQRKREQIVALEEAERKLGRALEKLDLPQGRKGVRTALRAAPEQLDFAWQELEDLLRGIQARNEANGRLIHQNLDHTRRLVDLVTGDHERSEETIYGTNGNRSTAQRSRRITQA